MSTQTAVEAAPQQDEPAAPAGRSPYAPAVPALASALLLWFAFPPAERGYLAWFALTPLMLLVHSDQPRRSIYAGAWAGGLLHWLFAVEWVRRADPSAWLAWVVLATFLSLWWPAFLWICRASVRNLRLPLMLVAPIAWVALEYVRAHILTGLPWYYLAHTQYRYLPLIQVVDLGGAWVLSFVIAMANAVWAELLVLPLFRAESVDPRLVRSQVARLALLGAVVLAVVGYGSYRLATARFRPGPRVALLQSNIPQALKMGHDPQRIFSTYAHLADRSLASRPDLIVWPETSYPRGFTEIDPRLDERSFQRQAQDIDPRSTTADWRQDRRFVRAEIEEWVAEWRVPMLVGSVTYHFGRDGFSKYNSALFFAPGAEVPRSYHKIHLVPFGEYVPLLETFPWLTRLTPYNGRSVPMLAHGSAPTGFEWNGLRYATAICFEDTVPHVVRRFFAEAPAGRPPDVLLNISNDGWFRGSSEHEMHLAISIFRAVENRVPLARAVNMGISAVIDGNGRIAASAPKATEAALVAEVPLDDRASLYSATGDWFPLACLAFAIGWAVLGLLPARKRGQLRLARSPRLPIS